MQTINNKIKSFLKQYQLDNKELIYLVGFSGGYDSMCLLHILKIIAPKNKIIALHLNHKWRGEESDIEELNCKDFCEKIGVEFYSENLSTDIPHTETAARDARYKFFEKCGKIYNSEIIFTAHNKNDNAETLIYRLCKGSGINGLCGILENRDKFYRPLLSISRQEIEEYCKTNNLTPNYDSSNENIKYKRNYIRSQIMPKLLEISENATENICNLSSIAKDECKIIDEYLKIIEEKITKDGKISTNKFLKLSSPVQRKLIYNMFIKYNLDYDRKKIENVLDFIHQNSTSKSGKTCSLSDNLWIFSSDKNIEIISKSTKNLSPLHIIKEGKHEQDEYIFEIEKFNKTIKKFPPAESNTAYVDLSKFEFNFELRTRQEGDIIQPYGMNGSQKLKKYLNSKKIPNHEKENIIFFTQEKEILWAINLGISDKIKVVNKPTHVLKFQKKEVKANEYQD